MSPRDITFSVEFDTGDNECKRVFLHFQETRVRVADSLDDFVRFFPDAMENIISEIKETYADEIEL